MPVEKLPAQVLMPYSVDPLITFSWMDAFIGLESWKARSIPRLQFVIVFPVTVSVEIIQSCKPWPSPQEAASISSNELSVTVAVPSIRVNSIPAHAFAEPKLLFRL